MCTENSTYNPGHKLLWHLPFLRAKTHDFNYVLNVLEQKMNRSKYNWPPLPLAMLQENEAILKTRSDVGKKEKGTIETG